MSKLHLSLARKRKPEPRSQRAATFVDVPFDSLAEAEVFKWYTLAMDWWTTVMRRTDHPSQKMLHLFWTRIPFRETVRVFRQACLDERRKRTGVTVLHIKKALFRQRDTWMEGEKWSRLQDAADRAVEYRLARRAVPAEANVSIQESVSLPVRVLFNRALQSLRGRDDNGGSEGSASKRRRSEDFVPQSRPLLSFPTALPARHRFKSVDWMAFPVRCVVVHGNATKYAGTERYAGPWYRPTREFFHDILVLPREWGKLGDEAVFLGYVDARKPYGSVESVVPEDLDAFRREREAIRGRRRDEAETVYSPRDLDRVTAPLFRSHGLLPRSVSSLEEAAEALASGESDPSRRQAEVSYYRGVVAHLLEEGTRRKPTRPSMRRVGDVRSVVAPALPSAIASGRLRETATKRSALGLEEALSTAFGLPPVPEWEGMQNLPDLLSRLRLASVDPSRPVCAACSRACSSASSLQTADESGVKRYCGETCYSASTML